MSLENRIEQEKERVLAALERALGVVTTACREAGIGRTTYYKFYNEDPDFKEKADNIQAVTLDFVESQLFRQIREGNTAATIFYLKTRGKERGYIESPLIGIDTIQPIQIIIPGGANEAKGLPYIDITDEQD
jgi:hypothetical protein